MQQFQKAFTEAKWHFWEPVNSDNDYEGARMAFGQPVETIYDFSKADVVVSLDADFLSAGFPGMTRYARDFAKRRDPDSEKMARLYTIESTPSATGAKADHRLGVRAEEIAGLTETILRAFSPKAKQAMPTLVDLVVTHEAARKDTFIDACCVADLGSSRAASFV